MNNGMGKEWVAEQAARQKRLDILYKEDWREDPAHPMHGLYTGRYQQSLEKEKCKNKGSSSRST